MSETRDLTTKWVASDDLMAAAAFELRSSGSVLDIGPGIRPQNFVATRHHICCEPYGEYVERLSSVPSLLTVQATWQEAVSLFAPNSVDSVLLVDVIEHLEKPEGRVLLDKTIEIAREQVAVFTPLGFMGQEHPDGRDAWGMGGGDWQKHRSGWEPADFPGWSIVACEHFHSHDVHGTVLEPPFGAFWAILDKGKRKPDPLLSLKQQRLRLRWRTQGTGWDRFGRRIYPDSQFIPIPLS